MLKPKILTADDDPDILDILRIVLTEAGFDIIEAHDGEQALELAKTKSPNLIILDCKMPKIDGRQVCAELRKDILLQHVPIIMVTGKGEVTDKVAGLEAGADDYIVKPFEPKELIARVKMVLRRTSRELDANPLTKLPGNVSIFDELQSRLDKQNLFAVGYLDLDKFKAYNDKYGFEHGDDVIKETARIIIKAIKTKGNTDDFIGHIGGDDFVFVTTPERVDGICKKIIQDFDETAPKFYNEDDRKKGYIMAKDRKGIEQKIPLISLSIGVVTNEAHKINHVAEISEIGAELKEHAKSLERSNYIKDQRK
ncbi:MAG: response regulator [Candidatus Omnitrophica bacterium]|nr:response regulator [Candidatus Omnitrophota bacterium]HOX54312.1 response regulator [Candidatus Omnitrophota bacterium]